MKNLLNIVLIASVFFLIGCNDNKTTTKTESIEPKIEQIVKEKKVEKPLRKDLIQEINTTGEVDYEALKDVKIETKKIKPQQVEKSLEKESPYQTSKPQKKNDTTKPTGALTNPKNENQPKAVQISKKIPAKKKVEKTELSAAPSHAVFDKLLKSHVSSSGEVDYKSLKNKHSALKAYLTLLGNNAPQSHWNRNEKLAFWINAYNAHTVDLILNNYPLKSITDLDGGSPWKVSRIEIGGEKYSLDQIENKIIRPQFKDPRIHFAVNCAAKSCPSLLNGAFLPSKLNAQLAAQTKKFVNNSAFNSLSENSISVSKIFEWYAVDFGNLIDYLNKYSSIKISPSAGIKFMEYDWALNGK